MARSTCKITWFAFGTFKNNEHWGYGVIFLYYFSSSVTKGSIIIIEGRLIIKDFHGIITLSIMIIIIIIKCELEFKFEKCVTFKFLKINLG